MEVSLKSSLFDGCVVFLSPGSEFSQERDQLAQLLTEHGALVVNNLNKRVSHVICAPTDTSPAIQTAQRYGIKLIRETFFLDQLTNLSTKTKTNNSQPKSETEYLLDEEDMTSTTTTTTTTTLETTTKIKSKKTKTITNSTVKKTCLSGQKREREDDKESQSRDESRTKKMKTSSAQSTSKKDIVPVDSSCPLGNKVHVYVQKPEEGGGGGGGGSSDVVGTPWACMLNQTNIAQNNNKFYVLQLLEDATASRWWLWTRWGRVGFKGQSSLVSFNSLSAAKLAFEKKFSEKTANQWSDRNNFQSYRGKYTLIELDYGDAEEPNEEKKLSLRKTTNQDNENKNDNEHESEDEDEEDGDDDNDPHFDTNNVKSNLPQSVFELVSLIFDKSAMTHQMMAMNYDVQKMPLGKLKKSTITKGMDVLKKIEKALQEGKKHELVTLSSQFYTLIPHSFGMSVPPIINTPQMLQEKLQMLETLSDIHLANTLSKQSRQQRVQDKTPLHPVDAKYAQLKTKLIPLLPNDPMYQLIVKYVQSTHGVTHNQYTLRVCDVFRVEREGERARFQQCCASLMTDSKKSTSTDAPLKPTVHLLWHGSRISNFVGILSQGLRIAPPSAPSTGYMFGKGIYFADCCSKSANYCHVDYNKLNSPTAKLSYPDNIGLLLLCQVMLGQSQILTKAKYFVKLPKGFHSVKAEGVYSSQKSSHYTYFDVVKGEENSKGVEVVVPLGPLVDTGKKHGYDTDLYYNEYVVYNSEQVLTDFLVKVEFLPVNKTSN